MAGPRYPLYERNAGTLEMVAEIQALILKGAPFHLHHMAGHCQEASGNLLRPHAFVKVTRCLMGKSNLFHQGYHTKSSETDGHPSKKPWGLRDTVNVTLFWRGGLEASVFLFNGFSQFVLGVSFFFWVWQKRRQRILKDKTVRESDSWPYTVAFFPWWLC